MRRIDYDTYMFDSMSKLVQYSPEGSKEFSPNNIRRIIISPDALFLLKHIQIGSKGGNINVAPYSAMRIEKAYYEQSVQSEKYKSAISAVINRVPRLLEEVIICHGSANGLYLLQNEYEITSLLRNYTGASQNIEDAIKKRFRRLASFIVYQGNVSEFIKNTGNSNKATQLLCENDWVKNNCEITELNINDWYKAREGTAKTYALDRNGSPLIKHLNSVFESIDGRAKKEEIERIKKNKFSKDLNEFIDEKRQFDYITDAVRRMRRIMKNNDCLFDFPKFPLAKINLMQCDMLKDVEFGNIYVMQKNNGNSDQKVLADNIKLLKTETKKYYNIMVSILQNIENELLRLEIKDISDIVNTRIYVPYSSELFEQSKSFYKSVSRGFYAIYILGIVGIESDLKDENYFGREVS